MRNNEARLSDSGLLMAVHWCANVETYCFRGSFRKVSEILNNRITDEQEISHKILISYEAL